MGERKDVKSDRSGRKKERDRGEREREKERERERERGERDGVTGEKEKKLQTQNNSWNFILSRFTRQNGVKHDRCRATITVVLQSSYPKLIRNQNTEKLAEFQF